MKILCLLIICLFLTNCATNMPTHYYQPVIITKGEFKSKKGILVGDCSWFENYKVFIPADSKYVCIRTWEMEGL